MPHKTFLKNKSPVILAVDDSVESLDILLGLLNDYDVRDVVNGESAIEIVNNEKIDLVLLDIMMPDMDGYQVCEKLKDNPKTKDIPIIFITSKEDEESVDKAYEAGGNDYITKPFKAKELLARVKAQLELKFVFEELTFLAYHDSLTGIYNRRRFFELGNELFNQNESVAAVMIDIDNFKSINDQYGHAAGDEVLKAVVATISTAVPHGVVFGRLGGEEFALLCADFSHEGASTWIEFIREQIEALSVEIDGQSVSCTISSGLADKTKQMTSLDDLLCIADNALYEAKRQGKNRVVFNIEKNK